MYLHRAATFSKNIMQLWKNKKRTKNIPGGTWTPNLLIRSQTPYPIGPQGHAWGIWPNCYQFKIKYTILKYKTDATTWDRTKDLSVNSRPLCQRSSGGEWMNPEGFEPPTFGSGIRRAAVAPWAPDLPTVGLEPTTTRLRVLRSTNWARRDIISESRFRS